MDVGFFSFGGFDDLDLPSDLVVLGGDVEADSDAVDFAGDEGGLVVGSDPLLADLGVGADADGEALSGPGCSVSFLAFLRSMPFALASLAFSRLILIFSCFSRCEDRSNIIIRNSRGYVW